MNVLDTLKDKDRLLLSCKSQFMKMQHELEKKADRFIKLKC